MLVVQNVICATTGVENSGRGLGELLCYIDPGPRADGERALRQPIPALCLILPWRKMGCRHGIYVEHGNARNVRKALRIDQ